MIREAVQLDETILAEFCRKHGVARLMAFGSVLRDDFDPATSDVDLLVEFLPNVHRGLFKLAQMRLDLRELLGREVDLTTPGSLSKYFRQDVLDSAHVIYAAT